MGYPVGGVPTNRALPVVPHSVDKNGNATPAVSGTTYETIAASQADQVMGTTGAVGDYLVSLWIQPTSTSPGSVVVKDGNTTVYTWPGGAGSVVTLDARLAGIGGCKSVNGGWKITTGANVSAVATGAFT
ncbi:MAG: hypothetical protein KIS73_27980 [Enhydrobacter sp.]|nr:hypothetical protein [Enhydrobacter sp.]